MSNRCRMSCLILAAALCAPMAMAAPESTIRGESSLVAPDVEAMTDEQLKTRMDTIIEALAGGDAAKVRSALAGVSISGLALSDQQAKAIGDQLRAIMAKYPAQETLLKRELFKVENLTIGRIAPNVKGQDTDGVAFELQDYRGKVVVIDFWGDW